MYDILHLPMLHQCNRMIFYQILAENVETEDYFTHKCNCFHKRK